MTYRQIEASREIRLWIGQVIVPALGVGAVVFSNPEVRAIAKEKYNNVKMKFKKKNFKEV